MKNVIEGFIPGRYGKTPREENPLSDDSINLKINELKRQMKEWDGDPSLIVVREWDLLAPTSTRTVPWPILNERFYMCIPKDPYLEIDTDTLVSKIKIKTDKFSYWNANISGSDARTFEGDINDAGAWKNNLDRMSAKKGEGDTRKPLLEIITGGYPIVRWGSSKRGIDMLGVIKVANAIGVRLPIR